MAIALGIAGLLGALFAVPVAGILWVLVGLLLACVLWIPQWLVPPFTDADFQGQNMDPVAIQELKAALESIDVRLDVV